MDCARYTKQNNRRAKLAEAKSGAKAVVSKRALDYQKCFHKQMKQMEPMSSVLLEQMSYHKTTDLAQWLEAVQTQCVSSGYCKNLIDVNFVSRIKNKIVWGIFVSTIMMILYTDAVT